MKLPPPLVSSILKTGSLALCAFALLGGSTQAATVNVINNDFEAGTLNGWVSVASGGNASGSGVVNNLSNQSNPYPFFSNPLPGTASRNYYGWICGYDGNPAETIYQDTTTNGLGNAGLQPNTQYTLKVSIGVGKYSYPNLGYIQLVNGNSPSGTVLAQANVSSLGMNRYAGNFQDLVLTFTTGSIASGDLTIVIGTVHGAPSSNQLFLDNVRLTTQPAPQETVGGGTLSAPAVGPAPDYAIGGPGFTLIKNWHFGTSGTVTNIDDMNDQFLYHDEFGSFNNGSGQYGANIAVPRITGPDSPQPVYENLGPGTTKVKTLQPVEFTDIAATTRQFMNDSLRTYLIPYTGVTSFAPSDYKVACGSFMSKWSLPAGGSVLNQDIVWETRVRYVTPKYFWFALWCAGNEWHWDKDNPGNRGAEMDVVESYGWDHSTYNKVNNNFTGQYWHSNSVGGYNTPAMNGNPAVTEDPYSNWPPSMAAHGISDFDATQWHIWTWLYRKDDSFSVYVDGRPVQNGHLHWTYAAAQADPQSGPNVAGHPINMNFLFDAAWGNTRLLDVSGTCTPADLNGRYYEFNYSRVYVRP